MWAEFVGAVLLTLLFLFVPGYFFFRGLRYSRILSFAVSPIYTSAAYAVVCIVYGFAAIPCSWITVLLPALVIAIAVFLFSKVLKRARIQIAFPNRSAHSGQDAASRVSEQHQVHVDNKGDWLCLCLYLIVGIVAGCVVFLFNLPDAASYNQFYDNVHHLGILQSFARSDYWSSLGSSVYQLPGDEPFRSSIQGGFYPSAWHDVGAMVESCSHLNVAIIENALNFVFLALVFPASMFALMRWLFAKRRSVVWMGSLFVMAAGAFPWRIMVFGPLFPNIASMSIMPVVALSFVILIGENEARRARVVACMTFFVGCVAVALLQPNTIFALAVFLCPCCVARIYSSALKKFEGKSYRRVAAILLCALFVLFAALIWLAVYGLPAMASTVNYNWPAYVGMKRALFDAAVMNYLGAPPQPLFALLAILGGIYSLLHRQYLWLAVSYILFSLIFAISAGSDGVLKHVLAGFWYTDYNRIGAFAAICAMPLAAMGASWIAEGIARQAIRIRHAESDCGKDGPLGLDVRKWHGSAEDLVSVEDVKGNGRDLRGANSVQRKHKIQHISGILIGVLVAVCFYGPAVLFDVGIPSHAALAVAAGDIKGCYDNDNKGTFDESEQKFVDKVIDVVPEGTKIVNSPYDGSAFAFASKGAEAMYRSFWDSSDLANGAGAIVRDRLQDVASDGEVASILRDVGAEYFMLLDADPDGDYTIYPHEAYEPLWSHLTEIDENTPGFELVLSDQDMRLYRILPAVEGS